MKARKCPCGTSLAQRTYNASAGKWEVVTPTVWVELHTDIRHSCPNGYRDGVEFIPGKPQPTPAPAPEPTPDTKTPDVPAYVLAHPAFFRRLGFGVVEHSGYADVAFAYGTPAKLTPEQEAQYDIVFPELHSGRGVDKQFVKDQLAKYVTMDEQ